VGKERAKEEFSTRLPSFVRNTVRAQRRTNENRITMVYTLCFHRVLTVSSTAEPAKNRGVFPNTCLPSQ
jgi:hypothetical protein